VLAGLVAVDVRLDDVLRELAARRGVTTDNQGRS
jgi:hypothetical protein